MRIDELIDGLIDPTRRTISKNWPKTKMASKSDVDSEDDDDGEAASPPRCSS